ncbi:MAG TPA: hypothetical protein VH643_24735 [Gemmataceae bacterium]|jgi:hypothetical protein
MRDPIERVTRFVQEQKRQAAFEHARAVWSRRIPVLLPSLRGVVEAFQSGLEESSPQSVISLLADPARADFPLVIAFERRPYEHEGILSMHSASGEHEVGASCMFRCEADGIVYGHRYPFHRVQRDARPERFADLGEPASIHAHQIGNAVVDFLEWAAIGDGCGSRKLRFWLPPERSAVAPQPIQLRVVAA